MPQLTIAIIGASADRSKFGNIAVRAYAKRGYRVFPVNLKEETIEGFRVYKSVLDIPEPLDRVSLYLPPDRGMAVLPDIAKKAPKEFFVNPGAESPQLLEEATRLGLDPMVACSIVDIGLSPEEI